MSDATSAPAGADHTVHLPFFMTQPGQTDVLFNVVIVFVILLVFLIGVFYFKLHALPEKMAHDANKTQFQLVAILALIALFTHNNAFWILALLLAAIRIPDIITPVVSMATSLERLANTQGNPLSTADTPDPQPVDPADQLPHDTDPSSISEPENKA